MEDHEGDHEITLNSRGMPARKRKKNSFYYNDDNVVCLGELRRQSGSKIQLQSVKTERIENSDYESNEPEDLFINEENPSVMSTCDLESFEDFSHIDVPFKGMGNDKKSDSKDKSKMQRTKTAAEKKRYGTSNVTRKMSSESKKKPNYSDPSAWDEIVNHRNKFSNIEAVEKPQRNVVKPKPRRSNPDCRRKTSKSPTAHSSKKSRNSLPSQDAIMDAEKKERKNSKGVSDNQQLILMRQKPKIEKTRIKKERNDFFLPPSNFVDNFLVNREKFSDLLYDYSPFNTTQNQKNVMDKKLAQELTIKLKNMLRLPKTHKWVLHEFFYSDIDKVLFGGENDFQMCLRTSFPGLEQRKLNRAQWCKIRYLMGKPRRCSQRFFNEEREALHSMRQKIRMIQQRKIINFDQSELPNEIPLMLTIGTEVTARIRRPQDGIFSGKVGGVDTSNSSYRITFDRTLIGTHSVPDYEVVALHPPEMVMTSSFAVKIPYSAYSAYGLTGNIKFHNAFLLGEQGLFPGLPKSPFPINGMLGGFPIQALIMIVRFSKMLRLKREKIFQLKELNAEGEKFLCYSKPWTNDFQKRYSRSILQLEALNKEMDICSNGIQQFCLTIPSANKINSTLAITNETIIPDELRTRCQKETNVIVNAFNKKMKGKDVVQSSTSLSLISQLTSLLLQVQILSAEVRNPHETQGIRDTMNDIKASLAGNNVQLFQNQIEIPMNRFQAGLCVPNDRAEKSFIKNSVNTFL